MIDSASRPTVCDKYPCFNFQYNPQTSWRSQLQHQDRRNLVVDPSGSIEDSSSYTQDFATGPTVGDIGQGSNFRYMPEISMRRQPQVDDRPISVVAPAGYIQDFARGPIVGGIDQGSNFQYMPETSLRRQPQVHDRPISVVAPTDCIIDSASQPTVYGKYPRCNFQYNPQTSRRSQLQDHDRRSLVVDPSGSIEDSSSCPTVSAIDQGFNLQYATGTVHQPLDFSERYGSTAQDMAHDMNINQQQIIQDIPPLFRQCAQEQAPQFSQGHMTQMLPDLQAGRSSLQLMPRVHKYYDSVSSYPHAISTSNLLPYQLLGQPNSHQWQNCNFSMQYPLQATNHKDLSLFQHQFQTEGSASGLHTQNWDPFLHKLQFPEGGPIFRQGIHQTHQEPGSMKPIQNETEQQKKLLQPTRRLQILPESCLTGDPLIARDHEFIKQHHEYIADGQKDKIQKADHDLVQHILEINIQLRHNILLEGSNVIVSIDDAAINREINFAKPKMVTVKCSCIVPQSLSRLKKGLSSDQSVWHLRLLIPPDYPRSCPVILDSLPANHRGCVEARTLVVAHISSLQKPISILEIARLWERSCKQVVIKGINFGLQGVSLQ